jgi:hypothetical protein
MAHPHHDPRTRPVPPEVVELARTLMHELGPRAAAAELGLNRTAFYAVVAGADVLPGTLALVELALQRRGARAA